MPLAPAELRTSIQRVLVAFLVMLVPLGAAGFYLALLGDSHPRHMSGNNIRSVTRTAADLTSNFIGEQVWDVSVIANNPRRLLWFSHRN